MIRMNSKLFIPFYIIFVFLVISCFCKDYEKKKISYADSGLVYSYAERATKLYNKYLGRGFNRVDVCEVRKAHERVGRRTRVRLYYIVTKHRCAKIAGNVCWLALTAQILKRKDGRFSVETVGVAVNPKDIKGYPICEFPRYI
ncbi:Hypothetical protein SRAE_2000435900 [Strongyloides ratti]|uniref:Proteinase inhibitor I25, cystatin domain-containing protein n=1 Tax=Strongyloides ratti TaxID=34506 RepID=A0A090LIU6_STRRB|nr:Hypothetical protein SRAE_2000435900 [Strongyloides ratti]CEF69712.2 Hypothetical protein SRAE_2000435900 [Strongyloides ratti]